MYTSVYDGVGFNCSNFKNILCLQKFNFNETCESGMQKTCFLLVHFCFRILQPRVVIRTRLLFITTCYI